jgi:Tfp pilus assembly protein PilF
MVAELRLAQGDAPSAARVLQPHLDELKKDPKANAAAFATLMRALVQSGRAADARKTLEPMLASDRSARALWLQLVALDIKDPAQAGEWTRLAAATIPASDLNEQIALGSCWYNLSVRPRESRVDGAADEAARILDPIVIRADAPVDAILLRAALFDRAGDQKSAEDLYRRGLRLRPDQPEALNNLAYLILLRGGDLDESRELISRAVKQSPNSANFLDTLGRVQARQGDHPAAVESFKKALALEPNNLEAMIGLAGVLSESGKRAEAAALLPQIDALMRSRPSLPPPVRRELDTLRATMKASL